MRWAAAVKSLLPLTLGCLLYSGAVGAHTALKALGHGSAPEPSQSALHWTYAWGTSASDRNLEVVFAGKAPERWLVQSWDWAGY